MSVKNQQFKPSAMDMGALGYLKLDTVILASKMLGAIFLTESRLVSTGKLESHCLIRKDIEVNEVANLVKHIGRMRHPTDKGKYLSVLVIRVVDDFIPAPILSALGSTLEQGWCVSRLKKSENLAILIELDAENPTKYSNLFSSVTVGCSDDCDEDYDDEDEDDDEDDDEDEEDYDDEPMSFIDIIIGLQKEAKIPDLGSKFDLAPAWLEDSLKKMMELKVGDLVDFKEIFYGVTDASRNIVIDYLEENGILYPAVSKPSKEEPTFKLSAVIAEDW
jgi:hypothetical protein